jgi:hypothetical protein
MKPTLIRGSSRNYDSSENDSSEESDTVAYPVPAGVLISDSEIHFNSIEYARDLPLRQNVGSISEGTCSPPSDRKLVPVSIKVPGVREIDKQGPVFQLEAKSVLEAFVARRLRNAMATDDIVARFFDVRNEAEGLSGRRVFEGGPALRELGGRNPSQNQQPFLIRDACWSHFV